MVDDIRLEPCPKCKSEDLSIETDESRESEHWLESRIVCNSCGRQGDWKESFEEVLYDDEGNPSDEIWSPSEREAADSWNDVAVAAVKSTE